jgi:hypothetical protein
MTQFELRKDEQGNDSLVKIEENGTEWSVPMIEGNSDYQRYLNPEAEQSTPMVSDEAPSK